MNRTNWIQLERWYTGLNRIQQWSVKLGLVAVILLCIMLVTHEPRERPRQTHIVLDCYEGCGSDPARTITYNEYMDKKEQQQKTWFREAKQQIQQDVWDEKGRQRWCRNHPQDRNCR